MARRSFIDKCIQEALRIRVGLLDELPEEDLGINH